MLASLFPKKERVPLERDPRYTPVKGSADWESSIFDPIGIEGVDEVEEVSALNEDELDLFEPYVANSQMDIKHLYPYHGRGELSEDFDYSQFPSGVDEDITENLEEVVEDGNQEVNITEDEFNIELSPDRKQELRDLLLSPEFQARPYHEQKEILEGFGLTEPDLLSRLQ